METAQDAESARQVSNARALAVGDAVSNELFYLAGVVEQPERAVLSASELASRTHDVP
jgi:hypothetical protein